MSKYTPKTWEIKHAYVDTTEYVQRMEKGDSRSLVEVNEEFDRWLESVKVEAVEAERKLMVRAIEDSINKDAPAPTKAWEPETYYYEGMLVAAEIIRGKR